MTQAGVERWVYRYDGSEDDVDRAYSIATASDNNIYAAGGCDGLGYLGDFIVISLSDSGAERWLYRHNGPGNDQDCAFSVVAGSDGNLYVAGTSSDSASERYFLVVSLTDSGTERWVYRYEGVGEKWDRARCILAAPDGNVYAAGSSSSDLIVVSLADSGGERWVYRYNGPGNGHDEAWSIAMDSIGNIYAAGESYDTGTQGDLTVVSLTDSGTERWVYRYNGSGDDWDWAYSIAAGADGNVYAAGQSYGSGMYDDFTIVSLTDLGVERWVYLCSGPEVGEGWARCIAAQPGAGVYAVGQTRGMGTAGDFTAVSLTDSGVERWVYRYNGPGNNWDRASSVLIGSDGNLYAAGESYGSGTGMDFIVISLGPDGFLDVAVSGIDLPPDTVFVDSIYGVRALVRNFGSVTVTFDAVAAIDGYFDTVQVQNLRPGSTSLEDFQNWQVPPADSTTYTMTVCTVTPGDIDTTNDCMQKTIFAYNPTGVQERPDRTLVADFGLAENLPNPFRHSTAISYSVPAATEVTLAIYDITGRLVETLVSETQQPGMHQVQWNRKRNPSGVYFYRINAGSFTETRKMVAVE